jgi:PAS domain S-box-containing protein
MTDPPPPPHSAGPAGETQALFDAAPDALLVVDPADGRVLAANPRACEMFGYPREELVGLSWADACDPAKCPPAYARGAAEGAPCRQVEVAHRRRDGSVLRVEASATAAAWGGRPAVLASYRDVTDRAAGEEKLRQAAKMEAVGHLAGGVAHDFNNLLTVITGYADVLADGLTPDDPAAGIVSEIRAASARAADLTRQLLAFSRKQVLRPRPVRLGALVENLRKMLGRLIGEDVRLVTAFDPGLAVVRADPGQLEQVLVNLAVNARDAMPKGGTLAVECRNVAEGPDAGRFVRLTVSDTGCGMAEEVKARIFEPFFTTKGPGKGTGLGLATVFGIVQQSGGRIAVESRVGVGTTFRVDLPVDPAALAEPASPAAAKSGNLSRGTETILLVEDEGAVRMMALHALQSSGYAVLDAEDGEQALRVVQTFGVPIRLLVTDVVMPGLGGRELADRLQAAQPGLRVLYVSGYTDDEVVRRGVEADRVHFLPKPFSPQVLTQRVREVLDAPSAVPVSR